RGRAACAARPSRGHTTSSPCAALAAPIRSWGTAGARYECSRERLLLILGGRVLVFESTTTLLRSAPLEAETSRSPQPIPAYPSLSQPIPAYPSQLPGHRERRHGTRDLYQTMIAAGRPCMPSVSDSSPPWCRSCSTICQSTH